MSLDNLLEKLVKVNGSDLFLSVGAPAYIKVEGNMARLDDQCLSSMDLQKLIYAHLSMEQVESFERTKEMNTALRIEGVGRFRMNVFSQMGDLAAVIRHINNVIPSFDQLGLPERLKDLILLQRGLLLFVGGTGTGKSTTLAAMIDHRNSETYSHILTIEDPVEFVHQHKKSLVNQREVGVDTESFEVALINAMREAPDVILIGEIRDQITMKSAINYAETGHLCLATLHANNSAQALDRILSFFPTNEHHNLQQNLSRNLKAIISQRLPTGIDGKRIAAFEILIDTPYVKDLIAKGKVDELADVLNQTDYDGQSFEQALFDLAQADKITQEEAINYADSKSNLDLRFRMEGNKQEQKLHKKVVFNQLANFSEYTSYCIKRVKTPVDAEGRVDAVEEAFRAALMTKGLMETVEYPDLELQFILASKEKDADKLGSVDNAVSADININDKKTRQALLRINMVDLQTKKVVWQVTASREVTEHLRPQSELNKDADFLFDQFPPFVEM